MVVLDTDSTSNYLDVRRNYPKLQARIQQQPAGSVYLSVITVEEMLRGALNVINAARKAPVDANKLMARYQQLADLVPTLAQFPILPYDAAAEDAYQNRIPANIRRQHVSDARIAAIALANGFTLVTRNIQHYNGIPNLLIEDWTL